MTIRLGVNEGNVCQQCNSGLGMFGDDPGHLEAAISYLARWEERHLSVTEAQEMHAAMMEFVERRAA
jgi:hypothetical protein